MLCLVAATFNTVTSDFMYVTCTCILIITLRFLFSVIMPAQPTYRISYFPGRGRAEVMRQILELAGKEYEDRRLEGESWQKLKPSKSEQIINLAVFKQRSILGASLEFPLKIYKA